MDIVKGRQARPVRAVIYGPEGIGKSTLASRFPAPLFVDLEDGTARMEVSRVTPLSFSAVMQAVVELSKNANGFQTVVFDTADWLERQLASAMLAEHNWRSIETPGYGKGYTMLAEDFRKFLDAVTAMQAANGMHVVFCAHAWLRKQELPDESGAFDRWEMKLSKHVGPALKEWSDLLLFCNYQTIVVTQDGGKAKAQGQERVMYAAHHACWDAKNRYGLAERLPMTIEALAPVFATVTAAATKAEPKPITAEAAQSLAAVPAEQKLPPEKVAKLRQLKQLMDGDAITTEELGAELARRGIVPADMSSRDYNDATLDRVIGNWPKVVNNIGIHKAKAAA